PACMRTTSVLTQHLQLARGAVTDVLPVALQALVASPASRPGLLEHVLGYRAGDAGHLHHAVHIHAVKPGHADGAGVVGGHAVSVFSSQSVARYSAVRAFSSSMV